MSPIRRAASLLWRGRTMRTATSASRRSRSCTRFVSTSSIVSVHAVNPPGYRRWNELVLPMLDNTIAAAVAGRATVVLPGTVYSYGPDAFPLLREDAPQHARTRKGQIRVERERRLREATHQGARAIVVRAGDFFGPLAGNNWFAQGLIQPGRPVTRIRNPGANGIRQQQAELA